MPKKKVKTLMDHYREIVELMSYPKGEHNCIKLMGDQYVSTK